jgi:hypothetical protein
MLRACKPQESYPNLLPRENGEHGLNDSRMPGNQTEEQASVHSGMFRNLVPDKPLDKVLYRDRVVIQQVYDSITAMANLDAALAQQLLYRAACDAYIQIAHLECNPNDETNFDYLASLLSSVVPYKKSVSDLIRQINKERQGKFGSDFVYPEMPVRLCGVVTHNTDILEREIYLHIDEFSVRVLLNQEHSLHQDIEFLRNRFLFVLGIVGNIEGQVTIKGGALLL